MRRGQASRRSSRRTYALSEVPGAIRYLRGGHARGKIVITI